MGKKKKKKQTAKQISTAKQIPETPKPPRRRAWLGQALAELTDGSTTTKAIQVYTLFASILAAAVVTGDFAGSPLLAWTLTWVEINALLATVEGSRLLSQRLFSAVLEGDDYDGVMQVSSLGRLRMMFKGFLRIWTPKAGPWGYTRFQYTNADGESRAVYMHRVVMITFFPHMYFLGATVDHITRDKSKNGIDDLRWASDELQRANQNTPESAHLQVRAVEAHMPSQTWDWDKNCYVRNPNYKWQYFP